jgi:hypothetical protein
MNINFIESYLMLYLLLDDVWNGSFVSLDLDYSIDSIACLLSDMSPTTFLESISADQAEFAEWVKVWNDFKSNFHNTDSVVSIWKKYLERYANETKDDYSSLVNLLDSISVKSIVEYVSKVHSKWPATTDYRIMGQERYIFGVDFTKLNSSYNFSQDHEHCIFCSIKITKMNYVGCYTERSNYNFICPECFKELKSLFYFEEY